jgi:hypothetical protein
VLEHHPSGHHRPCRVRVHAGPAGSLHSSGRKGKRRSPQVGRQQHAVLSLHRNHSAAVVLQTSTLEQTNKKSHPCPPVPTSMIDILRSSVPLGSTSHAPTPPKPKVRQSKDNCFIRPRPPRQHPSIAGARYSPLFLPRTASSRLGGSALWRQGLHGRHSQSVQVEIKLNQP